ncbi:bifunctional oligoribonuclease/PAP phosphatase NrnA [Natroniella sulfidigena]|uniref:DHH family phosphoesterase n=1 Tax=Natroniella sulfidigena TaxID=723921 RepID=UPI00200B4D28|nr:bifunctional oligoribonuclease/PAP phosphatase NrnA [Natroniella sulfidigena]MCK8816480.1 bifunctional oligoribonuclease/PAP phosphatase NrnA [Natroniella sulfidigena]
MNKEVSALVRPIKDAKSILLTGHVSPDGDNLGSMLALKLMVEQLGKKVTIVIDDSIPDCFSFLAGIDEIKEYEADLTVDVDLTIVVDSSNLERIARVEELIKEEPIINIDHHSDNNSFGDYNLVADVAATVELIYALQEKMEEVELTFEIATALATGLITDTGSFRYSNTSSMTHQIMAELLNYGVDPSLIAKEVLETNSYQNLILRGKVLQNLQVDTTGKIAWLKVSQEMLEEIGADLEDTTGLVNYPRTLKGAEVGILFKEIEQEEIRVGLRSNNYLQVNQVAHLFDGGGHPRAAGCTINLKLDEAEEQLINAVKEQLAKDKSKPSEGRD